MVRKLILYEGKVYDEKWDEADLNTKKPLILQVIPEVYFQQKDSSPLVILSPQTQSTLLDLDKQQINLMHCEYWPEFLGQFVQGSHLLMLSTTERALFHKDHNLVFFQQCRQGASDLNVSRNYLKRYGVLIPQSVPESPLLESRFHEIKHRLTCMGKALFRKPRKLFPGMSEDGSFSAHLSGLFDKPYQAYRQWLITRALLIVSNVGFLFLITFQIYSYQWCREEIMKVESHLITLSPEQKKKSQLFSVFQEYQSLAKPVDFHFAHVIFRQWQPKVVVTTLDWQPEGTHYTLLFHPDHTQEIESFMDWLESQHPRVQINKKDTSNGLLHLFAPPL